MGPRPVYQPTSIPRLGESLYTMLGSYELDDGGDGLRAQGEEDECEERDPPESYDVLLRKVALASPIPIRPKSTPWTKRVFEEGGEGEGVLSSNVLQRRTKYKPVDRKVRPVPSYMPDPEGQVFRPVVIEEPPPLPTNPPSLSDFVPTKKLTIERLNDILSRVPEGFLKPREVDLLVHVLRTREDALAFEDSERGTFSSKYFDDYEIPVIEHTPWVQQPIRIPKAIEEQVREALLAQERAGKFEPSTASYRSRIFAVAKKNGIRIVQDVQELNKVTVRDSALPPRVDDFAEGFVGRGVYGLCDLFAGYDGRKLAVKSRPLTTFGCSLGARRGTTLPQGATNSLPEFQKCVDHTIKEEKEAKPPNGNGFVDDVGIMGPKTWYGGEETVPGIRRTIYEYATILDRFFARFIEAGITASGKKLILATPMLNIVGTVVSMDGWHLERGLVTRVEKWPVPGDVSDVRSFLGTAGVGQRWIRNFSLIAKPLTLLTRGLESEFYFGEEELLAMDTIKKSMTSAPVLIVIEYEDARNHSRISKGDLNGLIVLGVDSCKNGAGWILQQYRGNEKKPALFGSCTFNATESRYSQPKCELYGLFRALKALRHRVWGVYFRVDVDAKFLVEMIQNPDLPNAPMTRWILYISLFDFTLNHVPAQSHQGPDGLSRRKKAEDDSEDSDAEEFLDRYVGANVVHWPKVVERVSAHSTVTGGRESWGTRTITDLLVHVRRIPRTPCATYVSSAAVLYMPIFGLSGEGEVSGSIRGGTSEDRWCERQGLYSDEVLLTLVSRDFRVRRKVDERTVEACFGDEMVSFGITRYTWGMDDKVASEGYEENACAKHEFGVRDEEPEGIWKELKAYLKSLSTPARCRTENERKTFIKNSKRYFLYEERLWLASVKGRQPRLVVEDSRRRQELIAEAHNDAGHRGRDGTYKTLSDRFYWPNMYDDVAYFVRSCNICQLRSKARPKVAFSPTWSAAILRYFCLDTVHMGDGYGGKKYLLQGMEPTIGWPEARASKRADSVAWGKFMYEEIICRFGHIPAFITDGGKEFLGAAEFIYKQYGISVIVSSPYHPEGNGIAERGHKTLCDSIIKACGRDSNKWPLFVEAGLLAMRTTTSRMTGDTPYYLLYGRHPFFAFDITDVTWEALDWDQVRTTEDLLATRMRQLVRRDETLIVALERQKKAREKAVAGFNEKFHKVLSKGEYEDGTWVLVHETWIEGQKGHKFALRWSGPFVVHRKLRDTTYQLRELDGTIKRESVAATRMKIFYFREEFQMVKTVGSVSVSGGKRVGPRDEEWDRNSLLRYLNRPLRRDGVRPTIQDINGDPTAPFALLNIEWLIREGDDGVIV